MLKQYDQSKRVGSICSDRVGSVWSGHEGSIWSEFPHPKLLAITSEEPEWLQPLKWGLIPHWVKDEAEAKELSDMCLNAVSETVFEKKSFTSIKNKRCLLPVNGFYETRWEGKKDNYPYFIYMKDHAPFYLGCLYDTWTNNSTGEIVNSFSILTTKANPMLEKIHNKKKRMPVIIPKEKLKEWIKPVLTETEINYLTKPFDQELMEAHTIKRGLVNSGNVTERFEYPELEMFEN